MKKLTFVTLIVCLFAVAGFSQAKKFDSLYTSTDTKDCRAVSSKNDDSYLGVCPGVGGYKLELIEGDIRQTINVVAPSKKKFELNLWYVVSSGFSAVGAKIEWRVTKVGKTVVPGALIIRYNVSDAEDSSKTISYLAVAKITKTGACVTDVLEPMAKQNEKARELADVAASKPCKE